MVFVEQGFRFTSFFGMFRFLCPLSSQETNAGHYLSFDTSACFMARNRSSTAMLNAESLRRMY